jgi:hypothetical protein
LTNLFADPQYAGLKYPLSAELERWRASHRDPGAAVDTYQPLQAARHGNCHFSPPE